MEAKFVAASERVKSGTAAASDSQKLELYALFKQATVGECTTSRPTGLFNVENKAKWDAWKKLGAMTREEAMGRYIAAAQVIVPTATAEAETGAAEAKKRQQKPSWTVFSKPAAMGTDGEEGGSGGNGETATDGKEDVFDFVVKGETKKVTAMVDSGEIKADHTNEDGLTMLILAVDRGHSELAAALIDRGADVNGRDPEGQTALHYAHLCQNDEMVALLLAKGADKEIRDNEGKRPCDV